MRQVETEFDDEVQMKGQDAAVFVEIEAVGDVDKDNNVHNVKLLSIYSKDHNKEIAAKDLSFNDMKRIIEKASDALLDSFEKNYDPNFTEFDDDYYYDTLGDDNVWFQPKQF